MLLNGAVVHMMTAPFIFVIENVKTSDNMQNFLLQNTLHSATM